MRAGLYGNFDDMKLSKIKDLPEVGVSHNQDIKKKVIIDKGYIPHLITFGQATFKPGQSVATHKHDAVFEVFHVLSGKAVFIVEGKEIILEEGYSLTIEPRELHSQKNAFDENVTWLYFGISTD